MKTILKHSTGRFLSCIAVAVIAVAAGGTMRAAEQLKGAQKLVPMQNLQTVGQVEALKSGDTLAMACAKCKTVYVTKVIQSAKGAEIQAAGGKPTQLIGTHACAGCGSVMEITGHGKGKEAKLVHLCKGCGEDSAFCCAMRPGEGPTKGMEKK